MYYVLKCKHKKGEYQIEISLLKSYAAQRYNNISKTCLFRQKNMWNKKKKKVNRFIIRRGRVSIDFETTVLNQKRCV